MKRQLSLRSSRVRGGDRAVEELDAAQEVVEHEAMMGGDATVRGAWERLGPDRRRAQWHQSATELDTGPARCPHYPGRIFMRCG